MGYCGTFFLKRGLGKEGRKIPKGCQDSRKTYKGGKADIEKCIRGAGL